MILPASFNNALLAKNTTFIDVDTLLSWGAAYKKVAGGEVIFREEEHAHFYYQIVEGKVKMYNCNDEGKEFIQGFFFAGDSFGEPPLFTDGYYPSSAVAIENTLLIRLTAPVFIELVCSLPDIHLKFTRLLASRLVNKTLSLKNIAGCHPEEKIISILTRIKEHAGVTDVNRIKINLTRQEIADMSGLRVETVIRAMRLLHEKNVLEIIKGKVFY